MSEIKLPEFVVERIVAISKRTEISVEDVTKEYIELFNDPFIQEDKQFQTDKERHIYANAVIWTRFVNRPPVKDFEVIPAGFSSKRITQASGTPTSEVYAFVKSKRGVKLRRIVLRGEVAELYKTIVLGAPFAISIDK